VQPQVGPAFDAPFSATSVFIKNSQEYIVAAWNFVDRFQANDKFFLMIGADHPHL
jgi:hypothetical protein